MIDFIIEHWKLCLTLLAICLVLFIVAAVNVYPDNSVVKDWTIQEAIFYGFTVLALATLFSK